MREDCSKSGINRRTVLLAAGAAPLVALASGPAQAKIAQAGVKYQATPNDGHQCDGCNFFQAPNACKMVEGEISPTGWCSIWVKKAGG